MKQLFLILSFVFSLQAQNTVICLPYNEQLLKYIQGDEKEEVVDSQIVKKFERIQTKFGITFGDPATEPEGTPNRRMCFIHSFTSQDETTGEKRSSDLTWLFNRLIPVAIQQGVCTKSDPIADCRKKVRAIGQISNKLPDDWVTKSESINMNNKEIK